MRRGAEARPCRALHAAALVTTAYYATDPTEVRISVSAVVHRPDDANEILLM